MNNVVTVCSPRQWPQAVLLAESLAAIHPEALLHVAFAGQGRPAAAPANVRFLRDDFLQEVQHHGLPATYTQAELLRACRPLAVRQLLRHDAEVASAIFISVESRVAAPLAEMMALLQTNDIVLCSGWQHPHPDDRLPDSAFLLNYGTYFSGLWGVRRSGQAARLLDWWAQNLLERGQYRPCEGLAADQLWLDLVPAFFPGTALLHHPGYGVHLVNAFERSQAITLHFEGVGADGSVPAYLRERPVPAFFREAIRQYTKALAAFPEKEKYALLPTPGLPDPPLPVAPWRRKTAALLSDWVTKMQHFQPGFLFPNKS